MNEKALLAIEGLDDDHALSENDAIELIGKYGIAPGTVLRILAPAEDGEPGVQLQVRMASDVAAWQLDEVLKLRRLAPPLVLADVLHLTVLE